jgi:hypothetical protein
MLLLLLITSVYAAMTSLQANGNLKELWPFLVTGYARLVDILVGDASTPGCYRSMQEGAVIAGDREHRINIQ